VPRNAGAFLRRSQQAWAEHSRKAWGITAEAITKKKAHYLLAVKGSQEWLHEAIQACFAKLDANPDGTPHGSAESVEPRRGRDERRRVETLDAVVNLPEDILLEWPKLETIARVQSEALRAGKRTREMRYYITTLPMHQAEEIGSAVRSRWGIENKLHWALDVAFREDDNRTRKGNGPECSAVLRHIVLNLLRQDPNPMGSIKFRRMQAAMSPEYRMAALLGFSGNQEMSSNQ
jgi:predicted transposase YbfD/YdcC